MSLRSLRFFLLGAALAIAGAWAVQTWRSGFDGLDTAVRGALVVLLCVGALYTLLRERRRAALAEQARPGAARGRDGAPRRR